MKVDKVLERLFDKCDSAELRRAARDVGDELPRNRLDVLRKFRAGSCRIQLDDEFQKGYLAGITAVMRSYEIAVEKKQREIDNA